MKKICLLILLWVLPASAQNEFTLDVPNALAIGYGGSAITNIESPALIFWNPGGLAFAVNDRILFNVTNQSTFNYIGFTKFFPPKTAIGFSHSKLLTTDVLDVATAAFSQRIAPFFSVGGCINYGKYNMSQKSFVTSSIGLMFKPAISRFSFYQSGNSLANFLYHPMLYDKFIFGIMVHNIPLDNSSSMHQVRIGAGIKFSQYGPIINFGYHLNQNENSTHLGIGIDLFHNFFFYTGLTDLDMNCLALGSSVSIGMFSADISYSPERETFVLSFSLRLNEDTKELAKKHIDQGTRLIKENDFRGGLVHYVKALSYHQNNERIIYLTNVIEKRVAHENSKIDSLFKQADHFNKKGWTVNAFNSYKSILEIDKNNKKAIHCINDLKPELTRHINVLYQSGENMYSNKKFDLAKTAFSEIIQLKRNHRGALRYLVKIDSITSYLSDEYYYRGLGYYKQRHLDRSKEAFERVLEIKPQHSEARYYMDKILQENKTNGPFIERALEEAYQSEKSGDYLSANRKYQQILELNRDNEKAAKQMELLQAYIKTIVNRKFRRAVNLFEKENFDDARSAFSDILSIKPDHSPSKSYLKRISTIQSDHIEQMLRVVRQQVENRQWEDASRELDNILQMQPDHPEARKIQSNIWTSTSLEDLQKQGLQLFKNGEYQRALKAFNQILEKDPEHVIARSYIDECQQKINKRIAELFSSGMRFYTGGDYEAAIREWDRVLVIDPNHVSAIEYKIKAEERLEALRNLP